MCYCKLANSIHILFSFSIIYVNVNNSLSDVISYFMLTENYYTNNNIYILYNIAA